MKHEPVDSGTLSSVGYDEEKRQLHVKFKTGAQYIYNDVPPEKYEAMMMAESKGKFLHQNIKGPHAFVRLA